MLGGTNHMLGGINHSNKAMTLQTNESAHQIRIIHSMASFTGCSRRSLHTSHLIGGQRQQFAWLTWGKAWLRDRGRDQPSPFPNQTCRKLLPEPGSITGINCICLFTCNKRALVFLAHLAQHFLDLVQKAQHCQWHLLAVWTMVDMSSV